MSREEGRPAALPPFVALTVWEQAWSMFGQQPPHPVLQRRRNKINIHVGGTYGNKQQTLQRFAQVRAVQCSSEHRFCCSCPPSLDDASLLLLLGSAAVSAGPLALSKFPPFLRAGGGACSAGAWSCAAGRSQSVRSAHPAAHPPPLCSCVCAGGEREGEPRLQGAHDCRER